MGSGKEYKFGSGRDWDKNEEAWQFNFNFLKNRDDV